MSATPPDVELASSGSPRRKISRSDTARRSHIALKGEGLPNTSSAKNLFATNMMIENSQQQIKKTVKSNARRTIIVTALVLLLAITASSAITAIVVQTRTVLGDKTGNHAIVGPDGQVLGSADSKTRLGVHDLPFLGQPTVYQSLEHLSFWCDGVLEGFDITGYTWKNRKALTFYSSRPATESITITPTQIFWTHTNLTSNGALTTTVCSASPPKEEGKDTAGRQLKRGSSGGRAVRRQKKIDVFIPVNIVVETFDANTEVVETSSTGDSFTPTLTGEMASICKDFGIPPTQENAEKCCRHLMDIGFNVGDACDPPPEPTTPPNVNEWCKDMLVPPGDWRACCAALTNAGLDVDEHMCCPYITGPPRCCYKYEEFGTSNAAFASASVCAEDPIISGSQGRCNQAGIGGQAICYWV